MTLVTAQNAELTAKIAFLNAIATLEHSNATGGPALMHPNELSVG